MSRSPRHIQRNLCPRSKSAIENKRRGQHRPIVFIPPPETFPRERFKASVSLDLDDLYKAAQQPQSLQRWTCVYLAPLEDSGKVFASFLEGGFRCEESHLPGVFAKQEEDSRSEHGANQNIRIQHQRVSPYACGARGALS